jgi:hypothetical protein
MIEKDGEEDGDLDRLEEPRGRCEESRMERPRLRDQKGMLLR